MAVLHKYLLDNFENIFPLSDHAPTVFLHRLKNSAGRTADAIPGLPFFISHEAVRKFPVIAIVHPGLVRTEERRIKNSLYPVGIGFPVLGHAVDF